MQNSQFFVTLTLVIINIAAFILVGVDKKKSVGDNRRVPEAYLFFMAVLFGSLGVFLGMFFFHHKTRKIYFPVGIGLLVIQQTLLLFYLANYIK